MSKVGQLERATQNRIVKLFRDQLGYAYLGNWIDRPENSNIEKGLLSDWLARNGNSEILIKRAFRELENAAALGEGRHLYEANKDVYRLLRYGVKVKEGAGEQTRTVWLIDWKNPLNNDFAIAEEVSVAGENKKRPDVVLYVNGIALGVIELKRSSVSVAEGIRQNLDNQKKAFIRNFFTTMQLTMAGNDTEGLRYGTIETPEKHYYQWKEEAENPFGSMLDFHLACMCEKTRLLEIIHDFIVFDAGVKKTCRHNQYFGVKAAETHAKDRKGGIIWHTQGSGKSLTMVWLAKWIRENIQNSRVLVITDRTELDDQIEGVFTGVEEKIYRTKNGEDLISTLNKSAEWLMCSLIHKFGSQSEDDDDGDQATEAFIAELKAKLPSDFKAKGEIFVFVDECHRTQSGKLHDAMRMILPEATFIGFTGTPLLKVDKKKSIEVFGSYIHTYKFDEAVADGVVLDLQYEARDIDQYVSSQSKIDKWFEAKTKGLSDMARAQLKLKWGTLKKVLSSQDRLEQIVNDILMDMETKPRLMDGRGNAMLVCSSIYQACKVYDLFSKTDLAGKCAIVTSYQPSPADIKGEDSGAGLTEKLNQYGIYRRMLSDYFEKPEDEAMYMAEEFEKQVKKKFVKEPGQMRLLIVVDKLLTGFDAPSATYLYIDKEMRDHGLFQAICRVNRLDGDDKEYGYIVDYKDLFHRLEGAIGDYTSGAFDAYEEADVKGLLSDRLEKAQERLEEARETVKAICEPVLEPRGQNEYRQYFCGDPANEGELQDNEAKRLALYKAVASLLRAYANLANELTEAGYSAEEADIIKQEVEHFSKVRDEIKLASGDYIDMKLYEPAMRHLLDTYIKAEDSEVIADFEKLGLIELIVQRGEGALEDTPLAMMTSEESMAETIENNMRKVIIDEKQVNPKYYEKMSELLDALIEERRQQALDYKEYLKRVKELSVQVLNPGGINPSAYPGGVDSPAKKALYDNFEADELWVTKVHTAIKTAKRADWIGNPQKERELAGAIYKAIGDDDRIEAIIELAKNHYEYR
ncbi:MAG: type I restriction endonuclease subunit R [Roseitalea sp.]|nr:type I restriction endonuclease subunit R [Roseitalea sp.]MBO6952780.1 type I restriction endonuclease subunit R [Rhizobiaceae bacterium]MBO6592733.1 type I restriction endonuclease subunit R [Roseitalea sp.]MBO6600524.1 type I restriction endonuclease subunit R [Roseitalea sp.]MBO6612934.1 type I restriction endonuclease subunit R [Roseitalea sp.]